MKHGGMVGRVDINQYSNTSGTYYYLEGLVKYHKLIEAQNNEQEVCLITVVNKHGTMIIAVAVDDLLVKGSSRKAIDEFHKFMGARCRIKRLVRPTRYLGWYFICKQHGSIKLSKRLIVDKALADAGMINISIERRTVVLLYNDGKNISKIYYISHITYHIS